MKIKMVADTRVLREEWCYLDATRHGEDIDSDSFHEWTHDEWAQPIGLLIILRPQIPHQDIPNDTF